MIPSVPYSEPSRCPLGASSGPCQGHLGRLGAFVDHLGGLSWARVGASRCHLGSTSGAKDPPPARSGTSSRTDRIRPEAPPPNRLVLALQGRGSWRGSNLTPRDDPRGRRISGITPPQRLVKLRFSTTPRVAPTSCSHFTHPGVGAADAVLLARATITTTRTGRGIRGPTTSSWTTTGARRRPSTSATRAARRRATPQPLRTHRAVLPSCSARLTPRGAADVVRITT